MLLAKDGHEKSWRKNINCVTRCCFLTSKMSQQTTNTATTMQSEFSKMRMTWVVFLNLWHCEDPTLNYCMHKQAVPLWVWLSHSWCCFLVMFFSGMFSWLVCCEWHSLRWAEGRLAAGFNRAAGLGCAQIFQKHMGWHGAAAWRTGWRITWGFLAVAY